MATVNAQDVIDGTAGDWPGLLSDANGDTG